jgi:peptide-methionine (S)-S-oxide reductase
MWFGKSVEMVTPDNALAGRPDAPMQVPAAHHVNANALVGPWPAGAEMLVVAMGCFWGAEAMFWKLPGVYSTFVGYAGGYTVNPTYEEVCSGATGHTEVVGIVFHPEQISLATLLKVFWEGHDPTQGMRQGNDVGTQYRSALYVCDDRQLALAQSTRDAFAVRLAEAGYGPITTEIAPLGEFYYAEAYHQQYLSKNPNGYCGIGGTGVTCPVGLVS